jgi:hypothetical protein
MATLAKTRVAQIRDVLEDSFFTAAGFSIDTSSDSDLIVIRFVDDEKYFVSLRESRDEDHPLMLGAALSGVKVPQALYSLYCPGDLTDNEKCKVSNFTAFLKIVKEWTERIKNELLMVNVFEREMNAFQKKISERLSKHIKDEKAHFTDDEKEFLVKRLSELEERLKELEKDNEINKSDISDLHSVIQDLRKGTQTLPKKTWYRTAGSKLFSFSLKVLNSKAGQKAIETGIDHLLEGPKSS